MDRRTDRPRGMQERYETMTLSYKTSMGAMAKNEDSRAGKWRPADKKDGGIRPSQAVFLQEGIVAQNPHGFLYTIQLT